MKISQVLAACRVFALAIVFLPSSDAELVPKTYPGLQYIGRGTQGGTIRDYHVSIGKANWARAEEDCFQFTLGEGYLVATESEEEDKVVHDRVRHSDTAKIGENLWTSGAYDSASRTWRWTSTGEKFSYDNWEDGREPGIAPPTARVAFKSVDRFNYHWTVRPNDAEENYFICEVPAYRNDTPVPCRRQNDLVIALDGSSSIKPPDFVLGKEFAALLAGAFGPPHGHAKSRLSFIVFSATSTVIVPINHGLTPTEIDAAIRAARHPASGTATHLAIDDAIAQLAKTPSGVPKKLVVLTDGGSNNATLTAQAAARAVAAGVKSFAVGIGTLNMDELLTIGGGDPANVFTTDTFEELVQLIAPVCIRVCRP